MKSKNSGVMKVKSGLLIVGFFAFFSIAISYNSACYASTETDAEVMDDQGPYNMQDQNMGNNRTTIQRNEQNILNNAGSEQQKRSIFSAAREQIEGTPGQEQQGGNGDGTGASGTSVQYVGTGDDVPQNGNNNDDESVVSNNFEDEIGNESGSVSQGNEGTNTGGVAGRRNETAQPSPAPSPAPLPSPSTIAEGGSSTTPPPAYASNNWNASVTYASSVEMYQRIMGP